MVAGLRGMLGLQEQAAAMQATLQQQLNNTLLQGNKQSVKSGHDPIGGLDLYQMTPGGLFYWP